MSRERQYLPPKAGNLLLSEPFLPDANFERSVILICTYEENGALGFVLNKPTKAGINRVIEDKFVNDQILYLGGPVQQDTIHFVHSLGDKIEGSIALKNGLYWGGNFEQLKELSDLNIIKSSDFRLFLGYSGWGAGQLDDELKENSWIVTNNFDKDILSYEPVNLWRIVLKEMGGNFKIMSNYPIDPRLN